MTAIQPSLPTDARYLGVPTSMPNSLEAVVVVPARNEAKRIKACLEALRCQWSRDFVSMHQRLAAVLVINGTTDATAYQVAEWSALHPSFCLYVIDANFEADRAHVGSARSLGLQVAAAILSASRANRKLLFSTDADSRLAHHAVCMGLKELDFADAFGAKIEAGELDISVINHHMLQYQALVGRLRYQQFPSAHERHPQHGVFGGAGFGVSLQAYQAVGGLPELPFDEDQAMRKQLLTAGYRISYPRDIVVSTSTRITGRTPWGMAKQLAAWNSDLAQQKWPLKPGADGLVWKYSLKAELREAWALSKDTEAFERKWHQFWHSEKLCSFRQNEFPLLPLPEAIANLKAYLEHEPIRKTRSIERSLTQRPLAIRA